MIPDDPGSRAPNTLFGHFNDKSSLDQSITVYALGIDIRRPSGTA